MKTKTTSKIDFSKLLDHLLKKNDKEGLKLTWEVMDQIIKYLEENK